MYDKWAQTAAAAAEETYLIQFSRRLSVATDNGDGNQSPGAPFRKQSRPVDPPAAVLRPLRAIQAMLQLHALLGNNKLASSAIAPQVAAAGSL
jgi:hypothetical protein